MFSHPTITQHFARFSQLFALLKPYRLQLMQEAAEKGWPLVRPMAAYYGYDVQSLQLTQQFMFGADFLVAPVLESALNCVHPINPRARHAKKYRELLLLDAKESFQSYASFRSASGFGQRPESTDSISSRSAGARATQDNTGSNKRKQLASKVSAVKVYLPAASSWVHLWSGQLVGGGELGQWVLVDAPMAAPPVFFLPDSQAGWRLHKQIQALNMTVQVHDESDIIDQVDDEASMGKVSEYRRRDWYDYLGIKVYASSFETSLSLPISTSVG